MNGKRFRRCLNCGAKSHQHYWQEEKCPVCEIVAPFMESSHGGLSQSEIYKARLNINNSVEKVEGNFIQTIGKER